MRGRNRPAIILARAISSAIMESTRAGCVPARCGEDKQLVISAHKKAPAESLRPSAGRSSSTQPVPAARPTGSAHVAHAAATARDGGDLPLLNLAQLIGVFEEPRFGIPKDGV
jgi:hypothetical protein